MRLPKRRTRPPRTGRLSVLVFLATLLLAALVVLRINQLRVKPQHLEIIEEPYPVAPPPTPEELGDDHQPRIALVIDDLGNRWDDDIVRGLLTLEVPITLGIIPGLPYSDRIARAAHDHGETVIAHVPMQPLHGSVGLGVPVIRPVSSREEIFRALEAAYRLPYATGMNNHMGSAATRTPSVMQVVALSCRDHGWFILDSITYASSVLYDEAVRAGVPAARRDIFLDHNRGPESIQEALAHARRLAQTLSRPVVVIGHPRKETWVVLQSEIPVFQQAGIRFIPLTEALRTP